MLGPERPEAMSPETRVVLTLYKLLFVHYVYLYTSCQYIYICHMFYMAAHHFLKRVQIHFDILNTETFLYIIITCVQ
jgi:hypothetical protein